jgi:hypothetical protein
MGLTPLPAKSALEVRLKRQDEGYRPVKVGENFRVLRPLRPSRLPPCLLILLILLELNIKERDQIFKFIRSIIVSCGNCGTVDIHGLVLLSGTQAINFRFVAYSTKMRCTTAPLSRRGTHEVASRKLKPICILPYYDVKPGKLGGCWEDFTEWRMSSVSEAEFVELGAAASKHPSH